MPVDAQPTMYRVIRSTRAVSRNELPPCSRFSSGTRTSFIVIWPFWTTLSAILCSIFSTLKPGVVLFSTMKPLTWLSATSRAQMIEISHHGELPIQRFWPLRTQMSPSRLAVVSRPAPAPEPTNGSVSPKQPIFSMRAIGGSHFCFCSSDPPREIETMARPLWTPKKVAIEESTHDISHATRPKSNPPPPLHPEPCHPRP